MRTNILNGIYPNVVYLSRESLFLVGTLSLQVVENDLAHAH